ncbi:hypothetical protein ASE41_20820 [Streptomyces sp. Root264]|nr:hypothetical protein ASE41_20820 [Streptomyces sp. Root264]
MLTYLTSRVVGSGTFLFEALSISVQCVVSTQSVTMAVGSLVSVIFTTFGLITGLPVVTCPAFFMTARSRSISNRALKVVFFLRSVPAEEALL